MCSVVTIGYAADDHCESTTEFPMRALIVCCLAAAAPLIALAFGDAPLVLAQAEKPVQRPQPQTRSRGGMSEEQVLRNPMARQILKDPDQQQMMMMDDPRFQALTQDPQMQRLMQNPQLQKQMQQNQQLRQLYQLQHRPLPGVSTNDEDD